jgi:hypothetical protein
MMFVAGFLTALLASGASAASRSNSLSAALSQSQGTAYSSLPGWSGADITSPLNLIKFSAENMAETFDDYQDTLPDGRPKLIHARGSLAPVKFTVTANPNGHTGLFATGGDSCVARLSTAINPTGGSFTPGMAIKCYRDNQPSGNIISMYSLDGQGSNWDFFANQFSNVIAEPTSAALKIVETTVFNRASHCATHLSLKQWSEVDQNGNTADSPSWPQQMFFVPADVHFDTTSGHGDFRDDLASIAVGSKLWDIYVSETVKDGASYKIAEITTTGKFIASSYSDNTLFFQHDRGEDDSC